MSRFTVGCVPYVNAIPLIWPFLTAGEDSPVRVILDHPSRLPELLESHEAQAILVSSYDALTTFARQMIVDAPCIGSLGPVKSVKLFSKEPFEDIRRLALDSSSMTSNALARILLQTRYKATPETRLFEPNLDAMLRWGDAAVLIGDRGMGASGTDLKIMDFGDEWTAETGLPFVWAAWTARSDVPEELVGLLSVTIPQTPHEWDPLVDYAVRQTGWESYVVRDYFAKTMRYPFDHAAVQGLQRFRSMIEESGLANTFDPTLVSVRSLA